MNTKFQVENLLAKNLQKKAARCGLLLVVASLSATCTWTEPASAAENGNQANTDVTINLPATPGESTVTRTQKDKDGKETTDTIVQSIPEPEPDEPSSPPDPEKAQVRLNIWAIQIAGNRGKDLTEQVLKANEAVSKVQSQITAIPYAWADAVRLHGTDTDFSGYNKYVLKGLHDLGLDVRTNRQPTLIETVILTGAANYETRTKIILELENQMGGVKLTNLRNVFHVDSDPKNLGQEDVKNIRRIKSEHETLLRVSTNLKSGTDKRKAYYNGIADAQLKAALVEGLTKDVNDIFLTPLLTNLQNGAGITSKAKGISFVGETSLVVSDGKEGIQDTKLRGYVNTALPPTVSIADLMEGLKAPNFLAKLEKLAPQPTPIFTEIAPGINFTATPGVTTNSQDIILKLTLNVGTETSLLNEADSTLSIPPANAIKNQTVTTEARVDGFNLFKLSSLAATSTHPRPPGYIPVLGNLPIIGQIFRWSKSAAQIDHHSVVLINAIIVPKTAKIQAFYGDQEIDPNFDAKFNAAG